MRRVRHSEARSTSWRTHSAAILVVVLSVSVGLIRAQDGAPQTDAEFEEFLANAEIVSIEKIGTGVTNPEKLTLRRGDVELFAVFKSYDSEGPDVSISTLNQSDRFSYDIAAYRLDRLIGLGMVPVTVERRIHGKSGAVQQWIDDTFNEGDRLADNLMPPDQAEFERQINLMQIFDVLVFNSDRNKGNLLYERAGWRLHLIDHTRAFRLNNGRPRNLKKATLERPDGLIERLRDLDAKKLSEQLDGLIQRAQINAILKRRDRLMKDWGEER